MARGVVSRRAGRSARLERAFVDRLRLLETLRRGAGVLRTGHLRADVAHLHHERENKASSRYALPPKFLLYEERPSLTVVILPARQGLVKRQKLIFYMKFIHVIRA